MTNNRTFVYPGQDHTLGVLLRTQLLKDPQVVFAAYKVPHPMTRTVEVRVQTVDSIAEDAVERALETLNEKVDAFEEAFNKAVD